MKVYKIVLFVLLVQLSGQSVMGDQSDKKWKIDFGIRGFKYSVNNQPQELLYNPVFARWENINQYSSNYEVSAYNTLEPLSFNMSFGFDFFIRYKTHLLIKIGYDYSNPIGIGGKGDIMYTDLAANDVISEEKEFSYTSHQINYFIGPIVTTYDGSEIFLGFSMMSPTWVNYREKYTRTVNGNSVFDYNKTFKGFFGNCRALFGIQVPVTKKVKLGSEAVFTFFNGIELESGDLIDEGFLFPTIKWNITLRYAIN